MDTFDCEALLYRIDPTRNMARFYTVAVEPTLFGDASLVRSWGRIGTAGRCKIELFETRAAATAAYDRILRRRLARGYSPKDRSAPAQGIVTPSGAKTAQSGFVEPGDPAQ
jgi:predicted DNA-binding WGR domain protein